MKKSIFLLTLLLLLLVIFVPQNASSATINKLDDLTTATETFTGNMSTVKYAYIPLDAKINSAKVTLTGQTKYALWQEIETVWLPANVDSVDSSDYYYSSPNSYLFILDDRNERVYRHYLNGTYTGISWNPYSSGCALDCIDGITSGGGNFWIIGEENNVAPSGEDYGSLCRFSAPSGSFQEHDCLDDYLIDDSPEGIVYYSNSLYITDREEDEVLKYSSSSESYQGRWDLDNDNERATGITQHLGYFWVGDSGDDAIYQYDSSFDTAITVTYLSLNLGGVSDDGDDYFYVSDWFDNLFKKYGDGTVYPEGSYLEVGRTDANREYLNVAELSTTVTTSDFKTELNSALANGACNCTGCSINGANCMIPFIFHSNEDGKLVWSNVNITYYQTNVTPNSVTQAISGGDSYTFDITISQNDTASHTYNLTATYNATALSITFNNTNPITLTAGDTKKILANITSLIGADTNVHTGTINVTYATTGALVKSIPYTITVNSSAGNIVFVNATDWATNMTEADSASKTFYVNNTGFSTLINCVPQWNSGTETGKLYDKNWTSFLPLAFNLNVGELKNFTVNVVNPVAGNYLDLLDINCTTAGGYDTIPYVDRPIVSLSVTTSGGGGGGGGGGGQVIEIKNITLVQFDTNPSNIDVYLLYSPFGEETQKFIQTVTSSRFIKSCNINYPFTCELEDNKINVNVIYLGNDSNIYTEVINGTLNLISDQDERTEVPVTFRLIGYRLLIIISVLFIALIALFATQPKTKRTILGALK